MKKQTLENGLTPEKLSQLLEYCAETGRLIWKARPLEFFDDSKRSKEWSAKLWNSRLAGKPALNCPTASGALAGNILAIHALAHRVAWAIHYGEWPAHHIDHINGNRSDNRIENLRDVRQAVNNRNAKRRKDNSSGFAGVYKYKNRWIAHLRIDGRQEVIGRFDTAEEASEFREVEKLKYGYHPNHGREM